MKTLKYILILALATTFTFSCKNENKPEIKIVEVKTDATKKIDPNANYAKAEFTIEGMTCQIGCAATIQKKISKMEGVKCAIVDFDNKLAMVEYNEATVTPASIKTTVTNIADIYKVKDLKTVKSFSKDNTKKACKKSCKKDSCKAEKKGQEIACKSNCKETCCAIS